MKDAFNRILFEIVLILKPLFYNSQAWEKLSSGSIIKMYKNFWLNNKAWNVRNYWKNSKS